MGIDLPAAAVQTDLPFPPSELPGAGPASCEGSGNCTDGRSCPCGEEQRVGAGGVPLGLPVSVCPGMCRAQRCCRSPWWSCFPGQQRRWLLRCLSRYLVSLPLPSCKGRPDLFPGYAKGMLWGGERWEETVKLEMPGCFPTP